MHLHFTSTLLSPITDYESLQQACVHLARELMRIEGYTFDKISWHQLTVKEFNHVEFVVKVEGLRAL